MDRQELEVSLREAAGKGGARKLRAREQVPGVVYGSGTQSTPVTMEARATERLLQHHGHALIGLKGPKPLGGKLVVLKEVQRDPLSDRLTHCDFYVVDTKKRIQVSVPLRFVGKPRGVEEGGVLEPLLRELEVLCLPLAIPERIEVNVEALGVGDSIHLREIAIPEGVEAVGGPEMTVIHVVAPRVEEVAAPVEAPPAEGVAAEPEAAEAPETEAKAE